jgi:monoamine oxidase
MALTRRDFLTRVGSAGGYSAAFLAMQGLGLVPPRAIAQPPLQAAPNSGNGTSVVILGGGIAGLVAAYELRYLGYNCTILEARQRPGGRNWTIRSGDTIPFLDGATQTCTWDAGHYQNFGPARLPSIHSTILGYCRKLGVELQVEVNMSRSALLQNDAANSGKPVTMRQAVNDTRGHVSELLMKCMNQGALDTAISADDRTRMLDFLRVYGPLDEAGAYVGSDRAGYIQPAGAGDDTGILSQPIDMHTLLDPHFWDATLFDEQFDMQATMFQPVGGMDRIPYAFSKSLGGILHFGSEVSNIQKTAQGVRIAYTQNSAPQHIEADFCICALPLTILKKTANDFSAPYRKVIDECAYASAYKLAWESRRFWEQDYNVYGGLEFLATGCSPVWLPSADMFSPRGVLLSGYTEELNTPFATLTLEQKFAESRRSVERLHPGHGKELEKPLYVSWGKIQYNEGSWIETYGPNQERSPGISVLKQTGRPRHPSLAQTRTNPGYETLLQPDGPIFFAGDHVSHLVGWQEGAALSALRAVQLISDRVKAGRLATNRPAASA